jgi:hypothetical protein
VIAVVRIAAVPETGVCYYPGIKDAIDPTRMADFGEPTVKAFRSSRHTIISFVAVSVSAG